MKRILFIIIFSIIAIQTCNAAILSTNSNNTFDATQLKEINIAMPDNCSAFDASIEISNGSIYSLSESFDNKILDVANNKFILSEINNEVMSGYNLKIIIQPINTDKINIRLFNCHASTPDAQPIVVEDWKMELWHFFDLNADGLVNISDVEIMKEKVLTDNATSIDLQKIINSVIKKS